MPEPAKTSATMVEPIVIVGAGPVGIRLAEELVRRGCSRSVVLFGDEPWEPYDRIRLSSLLAGDVGIEELNSSPEFGAHSSVQWHHNCPIVEIDREARCVIDALGRRHPYSSLVLATGSSPHRPNIPGIDAFRVYTFRDLNDTQHLMARSVSSRHVVVLGGGLLGLETARAMQRAATRVTVVQQAPRLMNRQLDSEAAALLEDNLSARAIAIRTGEGVREIVTDGYGLTRPRVIGVRLRSGEVIDCDTVVISAGIKPNIELAVNARLAVSRGMVVDETLQTSDPDIAAIGECAEYNSQLYGLVAPGYEQAAVLAARLCGEDAKYYGSLNATQLKVVGLPVFSAGETDDEGSSWRLTSVCYRNRKEGLYRKIVLRKARAVGAIAVGEWPESRRMQEAITSARKIYPWQLLRFKLTGRLWAAGSETAVQDWPATALVCNCRGVTRGQISNAFSLTDSLTDVIASTGASSVCGSCKPLVARLCDDDTVEPARLQPALIITAVLAILTSMAIASLAPIPYAETVQLSVKLDRLWSDSLYKQISGFSLLGLSVLGLYLSLNKRVKALSWGSFSLWRLVHVVLGVLCLMILLAHTGLRLGENLNSYLMANFLALALIGALSAVVIGAEARMSARMARSWRQLLSWGHIVLFWPLPTLLGFHVLSVYYF